MNEIPYKYKVTITRRRATTVYDRYNYTIIDTPDLADEWNATDYGPDDFFPIFRAVFTVNLADPGFIDNYGSHSQKNRSNHSFN